jgi:hypothetical protein
VSRRRTICNGGRHRSSGNRDGLRTLLVRAALVVRTKEWEWLHVPGKFLQFAYENITVRGRHSRAHSETGSNGDRGRIGQSSLILREELLDLLALTGNQPGAVIDCVQQEQDMGSGNGRGAFCHLKGCRLPGLSRVKQREIFILQPGYRLAG